MTRNSRPYFRSYPLFASAIGKRSVTHFSVSQEFIKASSINIEDVGERFFTLGRS